jgi:predicted metal-binding membrane protein
MCLLFVVGVMNFVAIAAIAIRVLAEKTLASGLRIARATAVGLIGWGSIALAIAIR